MLKEVDKYNRFVLVRPFSNSSDGVACYKYCVWSCRLVRLLTDVMDGSRILIFMETKKGCDRITKQLRMDGWPALSIHGDKNQSERDWVLAEFKSGRNPIMTATDVAARGLGRITVC